MILVECSQRERMWSAFETVLELLMAVMNLLLLIWFVKALKK